MIKDNLGDRMKRYEDCYRFKLPRRVPKIIRIDGKAFHTVLKDAQKPYDKTVCYAMRNAAFEVIKEIGGIARFAYLQSDECSIVLNDAISLDCEPWFDNNVQKMISVAASLFACTFNYYYRYKASVAFDARVFVLPDIHEVINNLIWRQQDASRNSVQQYGRSQYSHKELDGKSCSEIQDLLIQKGLNWNDCPKWTKRGFVVTKIKTDYEIPIFTQDRNYLTDLYLPKENEGTKTSDVLETVETEGFRVGGFGL